MGSVSHWLGSERRGYLNGAYVVLPVQTALSLSVRGIYAPVSLSSPDSCPLFLYPLL